MSVTELPIRVARTSAGRDVMLPIGRGHLLGTGTTNAGKSSIVRAVACPVAARADCQPVGIDLKRVELAYFRARLAALAVDGRGAVDVLEQVRELMRLRSLVAEALMLRTWPASPARPFVPVIIDELAEVVSVSEHISHLLDSILRLGRALGICVVACTQRAEAGVIGGAQARNNYAWRIALASLDESSYELGLGVDVAAVRPMLSRVSVDTPGVCLVREPGQPIVRARVVWWSDQQVIRQVEGSRSLTVPLATIVDTARRDAEQVPAVANR